MQHNRSSFDTPAGGLATVLLCVTREVQKHLIPSVLALTVFTVITFISTLATAQTTVEIRVSTDNDDAEQDSGNGDMYLNSSDLELANDGGYDTVGMRFQAITVPNGATITNAYIQFKVDETDSGSVSLTIRGQDIDDAPTFTSSDNNITSRTTTSASKAWSPPAWNSVGQAGSDQRTPDIASIIQEIVDRSGWSSGNDLVIIITGTGTRTAESYNGDSGGAPLLHIEHDGAPSSGSSGNIYYVRTGGNNSNDGLSPAQAWATFAKATSSTSPGDTVYFGAGTYTEQVRPTVDGSSGSPIRFIADSDGAKTGDSGSVILNAGGADKALELDNDEYLEFYGFTITGANDECIKWKNSSGGVIKDCILTNSKHGIKIDGDTDLKVVNCLIYGNSDQGIEIKSDSTVTIWNCTIADNGKKGIKAKDSSVATITNSIIANNGEDGIKREDSSSVTHTYNLVYGNSSNFDGTSQHGTEVVSDPAFVDDAGDDYHLQSASPAINVGTNASGTVDDDLDGVSRPIGPSWDMGCYEYPLLGHWQFDEGSGTTATDSSGNGYDGTLEGGALWEAARCGQAVTLDGSTDWIDLGQINLGTKAYTASVWFKTTSGSQQTIFAATATGTSNHLMFIELDGSGLVKFTHRSPVAVSGGTTLASSDTYRDGQWHHVAAVKSTSELRLYVDGELVDTVSDTTSVHSSVDIVLGRYGVSLSQQYFNGSLDEVSLYGSALSESEVAELTGLVGRWRLDETTGSTAADSSIFVNSGSLSSGFTFDASFVSPAKIDDGLEFDGSGDYISVPNSTSLQITDRVTIAAWVKGDAWDSGSYANVIVRKGEGNPNNYQLAIADGQVALYLDDSDTGGYRGDTVLSTGSWYYVAATWDGSEVLVYVNGVMDHASPYSRSGSIGTDTRPLYIGGRSGTDLFDGTVDDVRIYERALCIDEIEGIYNGVQIGGVRVIKWIEKR